MYYITFRPPCPPVDYSSLYTFVYKYIHPGFTHRAKIISKYNVALHLHYKIEYKTWVPTQDPPLSPATLKREPLVPFFNGWRPSVNNAIVKNITSFSCDRSSLHLIPKQTQFWPQWKLGLPTLTVFFRETHGCDQNLIISR